ncbi:MAG: hypothetical protein V3T31_03820, partial [candidate division Zixibacteria bacterium]
MKSGRDYSVAYPATVVCVYMFIMMHVPYRMWTVVVYHARGPCLPLMEQTSSTSPNAMIHNPGIAHSRSILRNNLSDLAIGLQSVKDPRACALGCSVGG